MQVYFVGRTSRSARVLQDALQQARGGGGRRTEVPPHEGAHPRPLTPGRRFHTVPSLALGAVKGRVGFPHQVIGLRNRRRDGASRSQTASQPEFGVSGPEAARAEGIAYAFRQHQTCWKLASGQHHQKLLAAVAAYGGEEFLMV